MPVFGGAAIAGGNIRKNHFYVGKNRFYYPPPLRKYMQVQEHEEVEEQSSTLSNGSSSDCSVSSSGTTCHVSNLFRFLEHTTPRVPSQYFPMRSKRRWKTMEEELHDVYFVLEDLWESFKEWSAYGAGVPLVLDGSECVTQYYNVSLSAIQLYAHQSKPFPWLSRRDSESARDTISDSSSGHSQRGAKSVGGNWNQRNSSYARNCEPLTGSSSDEIDSCSPPGQLIFEYFEHEIPYNREPIADKIYDLARQCPELKTYKSCDLSPASWVSLAWSK